MAQNFTAKRLDLCSNSVAQAKAILGGLNQLTENARVLQQAGGNFADTDFDGSGLPSPTPGTSLLYLNGFQANVFHQQVVPGVNTFLDTPVSGQAGTITFRQYFETMVSGAI